MTLGPEAGQVERKRAVCAGGVHGAAVLVLDAGQARVEKRMTVSEDRHPVLYGAVGLDRQGIGSGGMGFVGTGRGARAVLLSESLRFAGPEGTTVTVTSHRPGDDGQFERVRTWAPTGPYLASPRGKAQAPREGVCPTPRPVEVEWAPATVLVDGEDARFEVSDLGDGYWAAIGRLADAIVTIDSRGVPLSAVQLERLPASRRPPPPVPPDIGEPAEAVMQALDERFARLPFGRVHRFADHWALRSVEVEYARRLASKERLSEPQSAALERYWLRRVEAPLADKLDEWHFKQVESRHRPRALRRRRVVGARRGASSEFLAQLWFNTLGPGARTWFGNRYSVIRRYTFRLRWRP
jgi:hypothetical protein